MKRILLTICLSIACGSAAAQNALIFRVPQSTHDFSRDSSPAIKNNDAGASLTVDNGAILSAETARFGKGGAFSYSHARGIRKPGLIPAGSYYLQDTPWAIGVTPAVDGLGNPVSVRQTVGGQILTAGGGTYTLNSNFEWTTTANVTRLVRYGSTIDHLIKYSGYGWYLGQMELWGFPMSDGTQYNDRATTTKCPYGIIMQEPSTAAADSSFYEGQLVAAGFDFTGFEKAIYVKSVATDPTGANLDHFFYGRLSFDTCTNGYYCDHTQSYTHEIYTGVSGANVGTVFNFQWGGALHVHQWTLAGSDQTLLTVGAAYDQNFGDYIIEGVKLDGSADDPTLLNFDEGRLEGCAVRITGTAPDEPAWDWTPELIRTGMTPLATDQLFFHFTGNAAFCAYANDLSTIDAEGNWRTKSYTVQVSPLGSDLTTGDGKAYFRVPAELDGWRLEMVQGSVSVASSSGTPTIQLRRVRAATPVDMLSTRLTIDANEVDTADAAATSVVNASNDDVETGDQIYFDCDVAGTGTQGLQLYLTFRRW